MAPLGGVSSGAAIGVEDSREGSLTLGIIAPALICAAGFRQKVLDGRQALPCGGSCADWGA